MTKWTALTLSMVSLAIAIICRVYDEYSLFALVFVILSAALLWLYLHKDERDSKLIAQAKQERQASPPPGPETIPIVQKTSARLFVPKPLDNHR